MTTVFEQVRAFVVRLAGEPVCDDCIAEKLGLGVRQHANHNARELSGEPDSSAARMPARCAERPNW